MTYRPEREKAGMVLLFYRDGSKRAIRRNEYEAITTALREQHEFYEAEDLYGDTVFIRLAALVDVWDCSPQALTQIDADDEEALAYKRAHGEE